MSIKVTQDMLNKAIALEPALIETETDLDQVQICCDWLSTKKVTGKINKKIGNSYHLKHDVEAWAMEYVSNSAFIASAVIMGVPYRKYPDYPNIYLAIE